MGMRPASVSGYDASPMRACADAISVDPYERSCSNLPAEPSRTVDPAACALF